MDEGKSRTTTIRSSFPLHNTVLPGRHSGAPSPAFCGSGRSLRPRSPLDCSCPRWRCFSRKRWTCVHICDQIFPKACFSTTRPTQDPRITLASMQGPNGSQNSFIKEYKDTHKNFGAILGEHWIVYACVKGHLVLGNVLTILPHTHTQASSSR